MNQSRLPPRELRPATVRDVRRLSVYDVVPPSGRPGVDLARLDAAMNRLNRKTAAVVQRLDDLADAIEERQRERRRRGR
jgi:hypothetical protein